MSEGFPGKEGPQEIHKSKEVPIPEDLQERGYPGTFYFLAVKDRGIYKVQLIIKQEGGILGNIGTDYKIESFVDEDKASERADELAESASSIHWTEKR